MMTGHRNCMHKKHLPNTQKGFEALLVMGKEKHGECNPIRFVMEATGVYHENLAYFLDDKGKK